MRKTLLLSCALLALTFGSNANAAWQPTKPVEFIVTSGAGGGTDNFARVVQSIITKYKLIDQPIVVVNKGGGSGAEGYVYAKTAGADPHKVTFGTNNEYLLPHIAKLGYASGDFTPIAAMALDEFLIWVNAATDYKDVQSYLAAVKAKPETFKMGGSQSKDTDQTLTSIIEATTGTKFIYVPFQGGNAAAVQLAGAHIDSNVNNPNENIGQWKAGAVRPLCVFSQTRLPAGPKVTETMGWSDIPTCKESGLAVDQFQMPRTVWTGKVPKDVADFYTDVMKKISETAEWKDYLDKTSQTARFLSGDSMKSFIADDEAKNKKVFEKEGWVVK